MPVTWDLCAEEDRAIGYDLAHWQGTKLPWIHCVALGVEVVIAKTWHGAGRVQSAEPQLEGASQYGCILGRYGWCDPTQDPAKQGKAMASTDDWSMLPLMLDVEQPVVGWTPRALMTHNETVVKAYADTAGRLPIIYSAPWYWKPYLGNLDSQLMAECEHVIATYPKLKTIGIDYHEAVAEACAGNPPAIPVPWASRNLQPIGWQFDGDKGLYLPDMVGMPSKADVDVNIFSRSRLLALLPQAKAVAAVQETTDAVRNLVSKP